VRSLPAGFAVFCLTLVLSLAAVEGGLRLLRVYPSPGTPDRTIGWRLRPGARYRFSEEGFSQGRINAAGWRDRDHTLLKPPGILRIEVIGDSYVEAFQVPQDDAFPAALERRLNAGSPRGPRCEVIALGRSGMGTTEEYLTYERWGAAYDPDVVAALFVMNDFTDNTKALDPSNDIRPYFVEWGDSLALDTTFLATPGFRARARLDALKARSSLVSWATRAWNQVQRARATKRLAVLTAHDDIPFYLDRRIPTDSLAAFRITRKVLARFALEVRREGRRFVLFVAGGAQQEDPASLEAAERNPAYDPDRPQRFLEACGAADGYDVVTLTPAFRAASARQAGAFWCVTKAGYAHWNSRGHGLAAGEMARYFEDRLGVGRSAP
jgi:hypothetical protein